MTNSNSGGRQPHLSRCGNKGIYIYIYIYMYMYMYMYMYIYIYIYLHKSMGWATFWQGLGDECRLSPDIWCRPNISGPALSCI